jgi:serine-type D-Ala-D-Ala carboxypeptidase (penicillin-binding protein 5/6)
LLSAGVSLVVLLILFPVASLWSFSPDEDLTARAAILIDSSTGKILYQKEPDLRLPPASTTKIVTAILTLESGRNLRDLLTVSKAATRVPASKLYLRPGQTLTIEDLLYGLLLSSANDASVVLAEGIGGSVDHFAEMMTKKANEIGATNSHFTNPHGLTAPDHYSTARDLALLFRYAMKNATFREVVQTKISSVSSNTLVRKRTIARRISVRNHNRLLWSFDGALGGKTGYTLAAQKCFVGAVQRDGVTLIVSILGSRDQWGDTRKLLEYGFDNYQTLKAGTQPGPKDATGEQATVRSDKISALIVTPQDDELKLADGYVLQVGAFRDRGRAESLSKQIGEKGFNAFVEEAPLNQGEMAYRVRVGPYTELLQAQESAQELLARSGYRALILPVPTTLREKGDRS